MVGTGCVGGTATGKIRPLGGIPGGSRFGETAACIEVSGPIG